MLWRKALIFWKSIVVACAIAYVSLLREPSVALPPINGIDKYIHGLMYLVLTWMLLWDGKATEWYRSGNGKYCWKSWRWWLVFIVFPMGYGGLIEVLQEYVFYPRTGDWLDWVADCVGVMTGIGLWAIKRGICKKNGLIE